MNFIKTSFLLAGMTAFFIGIGYLLAGGMGALIALVIASAMNIYAFWNSDKMALKRHDAQEILTGNRQGQAYEIYQMVETLARNADLPMPRVYLLRTDQPNAFATGRNPENAAVAVTTGLLQILNKNELAGVIAHELAHIKNRDTLIMTIAATFSGAIGMLAQFGFLFRGRNGGMGFIGTMATMILAPLAASLIQMMISRTREYSADKLGAQICGEPAWLASALAKISGKPMLMESAEAHPESAHMFIVNPLIGKGRDRLFSTHPNTENRIDALNNLAQEWGKTHFGQNMQSSILSNNATSKGPWG